MGYGVVFAEGDAAATEKDRATERKERAMNSRLSMGV